MKTFTALITGAALALAATSVSAVAQTAAAPAAAKPGMMARMTAAHKAKAAAKTGTAPAVMAPAKAKSKMMMGHPAAGGANGQRSAISLACSSKADAAKLHGKPREAFRAKCMRGK